MSGSGVRHTASLVAVSALLLAGCSPQDPGRSAAPPTPTTPTASPSAAPSRSSSTPSSPTASSSTSSPPTASPSPTPLVEAASCPKGFSQASLRACLAKATKVYVATWTRELEARGVTGITPPKVVIFARPPVNPCIDLSEGDVVEASFWCGKNGTIYFSATAAKYWTTEYARAAKANGVLASDAAAAGTTSAALIKGFPLVGATTEFAHELGHWVQEVTGQRAWYDPRLASANFTTSNRATVVGELSADCMAGWLQGRTAAEGTWVDTRIGAWAHHATMAELGGDIYEVKKGFAFPPEKAKDIIGYGSAYSRLKLYDLGDAAGRAGKPGLSTCTSTVARMVGSSVPPSP